MKLPSVALKDFDIAKYASKEGLLYAKLPLKDGSVLHVVKNDDLVQMSPELPHDVFLLHKKGDEVLGAKGFHGSEDGFLEFLDNVAAKFQNLLKSGENVADEIYEQFVPGFKAIKDLLDGTLGRAARK